MPRAGVSTNASQGQAYPVDLSSEIEFTLEALANLDSRYEADRERFRQWPDPDGVKEAFLEQLEARHDRDRQPFIQKLANLQREMTTARIFGSLASMH